MHQTDIVFNVLLNTTMDNIVSLCLMSRKFYQTCNHEYFWINKFEHDKLPIMINIYPTITSKWIIEYKHVRNCYDTAKDILTINKIEKHRSNDKTDGIITIYLNSFYHGMNAENRLMSEINKLIKNTSVNKIIQIIKIYLLDDNNYKIIYLLNDNKNYVININYNQVIDILVLMLYHEPLLEILDEDLIVTFITKPLPDDEFSWYTDDQKERYFRRQSLWDAIEYLKSNNILYF